MSQTNILSGTEAATPSQTAATPTFGRYAETPYDAMTPQGRNLYDQLAKIEDTGGTGLPGPVKIWLDYPNLATALAPLITHFRPPHHALTEREREIAVCVVAGAWRAHYSTAAHAQLAVKAGVPSEIVDALTCGLPTSFMSDREQMVYDLTTTLIQARWIPQSLYERALATLDNETITDLIVLIGFYTAISLTLTFYDVPAGALGIKR